MSVVSTDFVNSTTTAQLDTPQKNGTIITPVSTLGVGEVFTLTLTNSFLRRPRLSYLTAQIVDYSGTTGEPSVTCVKHTHQEQDAMIRVSNVGTAPLNGAVHIGFNLM